LLAVKIHSCCLSNYGVRADHILFNHAEREDKPHIE